MMISAKSRYALRVMVDLAQRNTASGKGGGYRLVRKPCEYKVIEILRLIEGNLAPVACLCDDGKKCERTTECTTLPFWKGLETVINDYLESNTLQDMICGADTQTEGSCMS